MNRQEGFKIGVLLVNYNQWELTKSCVDSLMAAVDADILIGLVDNNTPGEPPEWVRENERLLFHRNEVNEGLTAGNNKAFELVSDKCVDYVFVLNNDTEVSPKTPSLLAEYLSTHPKAGIAAPAISFASDPDLIWSAGGQFSNLRMSLRQIYRTTADLPEEPVEMQQVTGCAVMMRSQDYLSAGRQDPELFVYYEDTDLCFRVRRMGKTIALIPEARVLHHVSISVGGVFSPFAVYFTHRNRYIVAKRSLSSTELAAFTFYYLFVTLYKTLAYPLTGNSRLVRWMWLGLFHGLGNKPGKRPSALFKEKE